MLLVACVWLVVCRLIWVRDIIVLHTNGVKRRETRQASQHTPPDFCVHRAKRGETSLASSKILREQGCASGVQTSARLRFVQHTGAAAAAAVRSELDVKASYIHKRAHHKAQQGATNLRLTQRPKEFPLWQHQHPQRAPFFATSLL